MRRLARTALTAAALLSVWGCAAGPPLPPPPIHANGQVLWRIVHDRCVPGQQSQGDPAPCALVSLPADPARGYVVLKDRNGASQYLVMPTARITGIEDPALLTGDPTNYFADAWAARRFVAAKLSRPVASDEMAVAVNSIYGRSQDQLHLHVDCIALPVRDALRAAAPRIGAGWSAPVRIDSHDYRVTRLPRAAPFVDPFQRLAETMPGARRKMGAWTLALTGAGPVDDAGFYLLAERADPAQGEPASGERLQDHACAGQRAEHAATAP